jgi:hypothetical protein
MALHGIVLVEIQMDVIVFSHKNATSRISTLDKLVQPWCGQ